MRACKGRRISFEFRTNGPFGISKGRRCHLRPPDIRGSFVNLESAVCAMGSIRWHSFFMLPGRKLFACQSATSHGVVIHHKFRTLVVFKSISYETLRIKLESRQFLANSDSVLMKVAVFLSRKDSSRQAMSVVRWMHWLNSWPFTSRIYLFIFLTSENKGSGSFEGQRNLQKVFRVPRNSRNLLEGFSILQ